MFDIGAGELLVIGVVALIVIGPKELPGVLRQAGKFTGKMRQMAGDFRAQFDEAMREAELDDAKKHIDDVKEKLRTNVDSLNPTTIVQNHIHDVEASLNPAARAPAINRISDPSAPAEATKPKKASSKKTAKIVLNEETLTKPRRSVSKQIKQDLI